ncbi:hypothetical protein [Desulfuromonas thiophila]|uniref:hypothetical protein n=1 Tax=Desulfuromonas thiophila TaxID=57664 RepID=UPI0011600807|nr:hypothetical protein [Desulfuromonas thiophila]
MHQKIAPDLKSRFLHPFCRLTKRMAPAGARPGGFDCKFLVLMDQKERVVPAGAWQDRRRCALHPPYFLLLVQKKVRKEKDAPCSSLLPQVPAVRPRPT